MSRIDPNELPVAARFWKSVSVQPEGCWEWMAARIKNGYGRIWQDRCMVYAHRLSWELHNGPIPPGMCVLHKCDNKPCVRPDHLFLGTYLDNNRDCVAKGRRVKQLGENSGRAKLTEADVVNIRELAKSFTRRTVAANYGVDHSTINCIVNRKTWRHVS